MSRLDELTKNFIFKWELFMNGCDAVEAEGLWDVENNGEMEAFYQNDLMSIIFKLAACDGVIGEGEAEYINRNFGFDYTVDELQAAYSTCQDNIESLLKDDFKNGIELLRSINSKMADCYKDLVILICDIIANSDGNVSIGEVTELKRIAELF